MVQNGLNPITEVRNSFKSRIVHVFVQENSIVYDNLFIIHKKNRIIIHLATHKMFKDQWTRGPRAMASLYEDDDDDGNGDHRN